jgi:chorismate mutase
MPVATEVANAGHVESCLKYNVDVLWVGARTTANPFSVSEIANALKGVDIPVMVKNPVNPDLQLWIGALERINYAGIKKLLAIHRGFSSSNKTLFRNTPKWEIPIELKTLCPDLKIICDPSHITGNRELIPIVAQKALDLDMSGLMIECHINPENALSDAKQQVTARDLTRILNGLIIRRSTFANDRFKGKMDQYRNTIDDLDEKIIHMIATRMEVTDKIGEYKRNNDVTILQANRCNEVLNKCVNTGDVIGLNKNFLGNILQLIHEESINRQNTIMNNKMLLK